MGHGNMTNPSLKMSHSGCALVWHFQPRVIILSYPTNDCVSYVLSYGQLQEFWIISGLQWRNVNKYRLPSENAHSPNYCSWLAVCVNYSANSYCKIALINRLKLYLIKTHSKMPKKQTKHKQKQCRIYLTFAFSERYVPSPGVMSPRVTVKRWTCDNAQCQSVKQLIVGHTTTINVNFTDRNNSRRLE